MNTIFTPFPILTTERLLLRPLTAADHPELWQLRAGESGNKYLKREKHPTSGDIDEYIKKIEGYTLEHKSLTWVICPKGSDKLAGAIGLWNYDLEKETVEIGYELLPNYQGRGIMNEAMKRVIDFGFDAMQPKAIIAVPHAENEKSQAILKRNDFVKDLEYKYVSKEDTGEMEVVYFLVRNA